MLIPVIMILDKINPESKKPVNRKEKTTLICGGVCCGTALFLASTCQQMELYLLCDSHGFFRDGTFRKRNHGMAA